MTGVVENGFLEMMDGYMNRIHLGKGGESDE